MSGNLSCKLSILISDSVQVTQNSTLQHYCLRSLTDERVCPSGGFPPLRQTPHLKLRRK